MTHAGSSVLARRWWRREWWRQRRFFIFSSGRQSRVLVADVRRAHRDSELDHATVPTGWRLSSSSRGLYWEQNVITGQLVAYFSFLRCARATSDKETLILVTNGLDIFNDRRSSDRLHNYRSEGSGRGSWRICRNRQRRARRYASGDYHSRERIATALNGLFAWILWTRLHTRQDDRRRLIGRVVSRVYAQLCGIVAPIIYEDKIAIRFRSDIPVSWRSEMVFTSAYLSCRDVDDRFW